MKYTIATFVMACFLACSICSCKNDNPPKMKTDNGIYSRIEKSIDSFINESVSAFSIDRIKRVAKRIEQPGLSGELVLDTLPDNSTIALKKVNGNLEFYLKDAITTTRIYSVHVKESISAEIIALELFENMKRRKCEQWRTSCNNPEFPLSPEEKLLCKLNINFYCK